MWASSRHEYQAPTRSPVMVQLLGRTSRYSTNFSQNRNYMRQWRVDAPEKSSSQMMVQSNYCCCFVYTQGHFYISWYVLERGRFPHDAEKWL